MTADDPMPDRAAPQPEPVADLAELEASLLTALALGQLSGVERDRVATRLAEPAAVAERRQVEELRIVAAALRTAEPAPGGSTAVREAVVAALGAGPQPAPVARSIPRAWPRPWPWMVALGAIAASAALVVIVSRPAVGVRQVAHRTPPGAEAGRRLAREAITVAPATAAAPGAVLVDAAPAAVPAGAAPAAVPAGAAPAAVAGKAITLDARPSVDQPLSRFAADPASSKGGAIGGVMLAERGTVPNVGAEGKDPAFRRQTLHDDSPARKEVDFDPFFDPFARAGTAVAPPAGPLPGLEQRRGYVSDEKALLTAPGGGTAAVEAERLRRLEVRGRAAGGERYARFIENPFLDPSAAPLSTFSIDVDTASYTIIRRFLTAGQRPPADAVRLEEMLNYFRYADPAPPAGGDPFAVRLETADCPWRPGHRLLRVGIKGREIAAAARPAGNLVFLVDVSGSMRDDNKLPLVKQALAMLVDQLREDDTVSIVTYAGDAGLKLPATGGHRSDVIRGVIDALGAGGSTHGSAGIELAYDEAKRHFITGGVNRVILCTDGDLNVGITDDEQLVKLIRARAAEGTFLTVLGFGQGNLQDEKMEKLADNGNGLYAYIDSVREARKVLIEQLTGSTVTIAKDVKIQVEFNPALVDSYRLLGYENRVMAAKDFADDTKDAGEIGAGHGVTALYEYVPAGAGGATLPDLKYQPRPAPVPQPVVAGPTARELLTLKLRFKEPAGSESVLREIPLVDAGGSFESATDDLRFAAAVAAFGMLLRSSDHAGTATLPLVAEIAAGAMGSDPGGLRAEFLDLVRSAGQVLPSDGRE